MNERAVVYVTDAKSKQPEWVDKFDLPPHTYQSRATHCTRAVGALFVLQQSDTQPEQALSQTLLRVVKLDPVTGAVQKQRDIQVPGAFSVWVTEGSSHFQWSRNALAVSGNERTQAAPDQDVTFTLHMNADLEPISGHRP